MKNRLFISFSAKSDGNCAEIINAYKTEHDDSVLFKDLQVHPCSNCEYECMSGICKYRDDDIYKLYSSFVHYEKIYLLIPMYCSNPCSLFFIFNERGQDYFMHNELTYNIDERLFYIGIYGAKEEYPLFLEHFRNDALQGKHILGIERHKYHIKLNESVLAIKEIRKQLDEFLTL